MQPNTDLVESTSNFWSVLPQIFSPHFHSIALHENHFINLNSRARADSGAIELTVSNTGESGAGIQINKVVFMQSDEMKARRENLR